MEWLSYVSLWRKWMASLSKVVSHQQFVYTGVWLFIQMRKQRMKRVLMGNNSSAIGGYFFKEKAGCRMKRALMRNNTSTICVWLFIQTRKKVIEWRWNTIRLFHKCHACMMQVGKFSLTSSPTDDRFDSIWFFPTVNNRSLSVSRIRVSLLSVKQARTTININPRCTYLSARPLYDSPPCEICVLSFWLFWTFKALFSSMPSERNAIALRSEVCSAKPTLYSYARARQVYACAHSRAACFVASVVTKPASGQWRNWNSQFWPFSGVFSQCNLFYLIIIGRSTRS